MTISDRHLLQNLHHPITNELVCYWARKKVLGNKGCLYHTRHSERFFFYAVENVACSYDKINMYIMPIFYGTGSKHGVDSIFAGDEYVTDRPYIYKPNMYVVIELIKEIKNIELLSCDTDDLTPEHEIDIANLFKYED